MQTITIITMSQELLFSSKEFKQLLQVSDCELMHLRTAGKLSFTKKGNTFLYQLNEKKLLLNHPITKQVINWYQDKHPVSLDNTPKEVDSINSLINLVEKILLPVNRHFGEIEITYGFTSYELNRYIQKNSSTGTSPYLDQHSASEFNSANNLICKRDGLACDFIIHGYENKMNNIMFYIVNNLDFDKIYYYGNDRPLHVSVSNEPERHLQIMNISSKGRRIPGKRAYGENTKILANELLK